MREGQAKVLSPAEEHRVRTVAAAGRHGLRNLVLLDFSFKLGLRVKEMASLTIDDVVDGEGHLVTMFQLASDRPKGEYGRYVYLTNKRVRKNLQAYLEQRSGDSNRSLFKSQKTAFTPNSLQQVFKRLYDAAGIKGAKSHSGRRTFATRLIESGYDLRSVSTLMGHAHVQTTARYISENPVRLGEMVARL